MFGINALSYVARMANVLTFWYSPAQLRKYISMRWLMLAFAINVTVSSAGKSAHPDPASAPWELFDIGIYGQHQAAFRKNLSLSLPARICIGHSRPFCR